MTGLTTLGPDLAAKRLQLLKESFPRVSHVVLLFEPANRGTLSQEKEIEQAAPRLGMRVTQIELRQPADIELAFNRGAAIGAQAYIMTQGGVFSSQRQAIVDRISRLKVPAIAGGAEYADAGGLIS